MKRQGEQLPWTKLTEADVRKIRMLDEERRDCLKRAAELSAAALAKRFGVHERTIRKITSGSTWVDV